MTDPELAGAAVAGRSADIPELRMVIVFENERLSGHALAACHHLMSRFDGCFTYRVACASYRTLQRVQHYAHLLTVSRTADLVFVAGDIPLPDTVSHWLSDCLDCHEEEDFALVDMTAAGLHSSPEVHQALIRQLPRHHADLIRECRIREQLHYNAASMMESARHSPPRHWGINE